jgi:hypothetical protein
MLEDNPGLVVLKDHDFSFTSVVDTGSKSIFLLLSSVVPRTTLVLSMRRTVLAERAMLCCAEQTMLLDRVELVRESRDQDAGRARP